MKRILGLDFLRGLAILGMVFYHVLFMVYFYGLVEVDFSVWWLFLFARVVQFVFLGLVGVGMALSFKRLEGFYGRQLRRFFLIMGLALVVSGVTYLMIPDYFVRFGVLHLIAVSSLILMVLARWRFVVLGLVFLSVFLPFGLFDGASVDYFPLFPWFFVIGCGFLLGDAVVRKVEGWGGVWWINFLGRNSLWVYMTHVPVIWVLMRVFMVI